MVPIPSLACLFSFYTIPNLLVLPSFLMCYAQCCHGDGSGVRHVHIKYHGHLLYYQATVLAIARGYLLLSFCCCHGDGSDGLHVWHGHTHHYQPTMLEIVINCMRLFAFVILLLPWLRAIPGLKYLLCRKGTLMVYETQSQLV